MTKAQYKVLNRLQKKQTNRVDVSVVESSETSVTFYVAFPGLYLTYDRVGKLISTETPVEREKAGRELTRAGGPVLKGEMGSGEYRPALVEVWDDESDSVPF